MMAAHEPESVDLAKFVETTLVSIVKGVRDAQEATVEWAAMWGVSVIAMPSGNGGVASSAGQTKLSKIEFDIQVSVEAQTRGGGGVRVKILEAGAERSATQSAAQRIKFEVPVAFPSHSRPRPPND